MDNTIAVLFCIWVVSEVIDNIKKYKMEKTQQFAVETLREEYQKMQKRIDDLEKENHNLKLVLENISEEKG